MQKKHFFQISPMLVFLLCLCLYFGNWNYIFSVLLAAALHELGHLFFLAAAGKKARKLFLKANSAVIDTSDLSYRQELFCALCGPLMNFVLCLCFLGSGKVFSAANLFLAFYNLLPIFPLDGGRVLRTVLLLKLEEARAKRIVFSVGFVFSLILLFLAMWLCVVLQCTLWPGFAVGIILLKLDADARREWH